VSTPTEVKERPILFSADMVVALLTERKRQTRRIVKPQPTLPYMIPLEHHDGTPGAVFSPEPSLRDGLQIETRYCPYGKPGDRLWVRETWGSATATDAAVCIAYRADNAVYHTLHENGGEGDAVAVDWSSRPDCDWCIKEPGFRWTPSIFMPRWASRITLEITRVRLELVQDISRDDAEAEGVWVATERDDSIVEAAMRMYGKSGRPVGPIDYFAVIWSQLNGKRGFNWYENPFVWALDFKRVEASV